MLQYTMIKKNITVYVMDMGVVNMGYTLNKYHRNLSDEELIKDLSNVAIMIGQNTVTIDEYNQNGKYHATTLTRRFGSWFNCLEKAGLEPSRSAINISEEELFLNLEKLWKYFGRQPKYHEIKKPLSEFSVGTYEKRFGTYYNALEAFIKEVNGDVSDKKMENLHTLNPRFINYRMRFKVMQRDGFKCKICGKSPANDPEIKLHIDHIIPCCKGGTAELTNLQTLCSKCNLGKSDLDM